VKTQQANSELVKAQRRPRVLQREREVYRWMPRLREVTLVPKVEGARRKTCARRREVVRTLGGTVHGLA
jgi:hypothetical protein